jgi:uncharacterized OsmC-like protein
MTKADVSLRDNPQIKIVRAEANCNGNFCNTIATRDFTFVIAEPEKLGGNNEGPTPMEYVVGALNGCLGIVIELVAKERGISLGELKVTSAGLVDQRGLFGTADVSPHFQSIEVDISLTTSASSQAISKLKTDVLRRCPVYNLIKDSGAKVKIEWNISGEKR